MLRCASRARALRKRAPSRRPPGTRLRASTRSSESVVPEGYELIRVTDIHEFAARATMLRHKRTGAEILSMEKDDDNKCFGIGFKTPVEDSKGTPHILEHSVLCGSRRYTAKSPFTEMRKGSLNTFLNALTYPDRTLYPVASQNTADFHNLVNVYLDAVFHPRAVKDPLVLAQEGWHYDIKSPDDPLRISGVVYNEMKGVYSSPDSLHSRFTLQSIFPDNNYKSDSGGDPSQIPTLTFEEFRRFHARHYSPKNSCIFFYGNDPVKDRFRILDSYLNEFDLSETGPAPGEICDTGANKQQVSTAQQRLLTQAYETRQTFPVAEGRDDTGGHYATVGWLLSADGFDNYDNIVWSLISTLLMGSSASVLEKALTDSGLGAAVIGQGFTRYLRQPFFTVGLKGLGSDADARAVESLIQTVVENVVAGGFDAADVDAAMNIIEFHTREFDTGSSQRGIAFLKGAMSVWVYGRDPTNYFRHEKELAELRERIYSDGGQYRPGYLEGILNQGLVQNNHRVLAVSSPDETLAKRQEDAMSEQLSKKKAAMSKKDLEDAVRVAEALRHAQSTPDTPEAIASIPSLSLSDVGTQARHWSSDSQTVGLIEDGLVHTAETNGIAYITALADLPLIAETDIPLLPLFSRLLSGTAGTERKSRVEIRQYIDTHTGGVSVGLGASLPPHVRCASTGACVVGDPMAYKMRLAVTGKVLASKSDNFFDVVKELVFDVRLDDRARVLELLKESKSGMESALIRSGRAYATGILSAQNTAIGSFHDRAGGIRYYRALTGILQEAEHDYASLHARLESLRGTVARCMVPENLTLNITADAKSQPMVLSAADHFSKILPTDADPAPSASSTPMLPTGPRGLGIAIPSQVNYVVLGGRLLAPGMRVPGSASVATNILRTGYLWEKVRVQGGAYGAGISVGSRDGTFAFSSYRDPNFLDTISAFINAADFLSTISLSESELERAILGVVAELDYPVTAKGAGRIALTRHLTGYSTKDAQRLRDEVLGTKVSDIRAFGEQLRNALVDPRSVGGGNTASVVAFGPKSVLESAREGAAKAGLGDFFSSDYAVSTPSEGPL